MRLSIQAEIRNVSTKQIIDLLVIFDDNLSHIMKIIRYLDERLLKVSHGYGIYTSSDI